MTERAVQWTLLRDWHYLKECVGLPILRLIAEYLGTDCGVVDFVLQCSRKPQIVVVELETGITSSSKLRYCVSQANSYKSIGFPPYETRHAVLYARDASSPRLAEQLERDLQAIDVIVCKYDLAVVEQIFHQLLAERSRTAGLALDPPIAMDVCYLRWMNQIARIFKDHGVDKLPSSVFYDPKGGTFYHSSTTFNVRKRLLLDFELVKESAEGNRKELQLTELGRRFVEALIPDILVGQAGLPPLSAEQVRILLESLTNGQVTKCKANIYHFLRFIHLTEGLWVPKARAPEPVKGQPEFEYWQLFRALAGARIWNWNTTREFLAFTCNQCSELGLVERLHNEHRNYHRVAFTSLGSRLLGWLELDQHLKRESIQLPLQLETVVRP